MLTCAVERGWGRGKRQPPLPPPLQGNDYNQTAQGNCRGWVGLAVGQRGERPMHLIHTGA